MRPRPSTCCGLLGLFVLLAGCTAPTEIVVVVDTDRVIPAGLDEVVIEVDGEVVGRSTLGSAADLPRTLGVAAGSGRTRLSGRVRGLAQGSEVASVSFDVGFVLARRQVLYVFLGDAPEACIREWNVEVTKHQASSRCELGDAGPMDASTPDAGAADAGDVDAQTEPPDAGADAEASPPDAGPDAGCLVHSDCSDGEACTDDICEPNGSCSHSALDDGEVCGMRVISRSACVDSNCDGQGQERVQTLVSRCTTGACREFPTPVHSSPSCAAGAGSRCDESVGGFRCCNNLCVDTRTDRAHCGGCGIQCGAASSCAGGFGGSACTCTPVSAGSACPNGGVNWACIGEKDSERCLCTDASACADGQACSPEGLCDYDPNT